MSKGRFIERADDNDVGIAIARIRARKVDMLEQRRAHMCDTRTCNPQSEAAFYDDPRTRNVFLCRLGSLHVCSQYECPYYSNSREQVCPISHIDLGSGPAVSSYDSGDCRTWYAQIDSGAPGTPGTAGAGLPNAILAPPQVINTDELRVRASAMVKLLLFSKYRVTCNKVAYAGFKQEARDSLQTYRKSQLAKRQAPHMTDKYRLRAHFTDQPLPYSVYEYNADLHDYYVGVCMQVWAMATRYYSCIGGADTIPRLDFDQLCLGVLYTMRQGRRASNIVMLPVDDFLLMNLPIISHLTVFGIGKNQVTKGEKILSQMYDNAAAARVDPRAMALDVALMPQKRVAEQEEEEQHAGSVRVKVTSSGEKLFMPSSRRKQ